MLARRNLHSFALVIFLAFPFIAVASINKFFGPLPDEQSAKLQSAKVVADCPCGEDCACVDCKCEKRPKAKVDPLRLDTTKGGDSLTVPTIITWGICQYNPGTKELYFLGTVSTPRSSEVSSLAMKKWELKKTDSLAMFPMSGQGKLEFSFVYGDGVIFPPSDDSPIAPKSTKLPQVSADEEINEARGNIGPK